MSISELLGRPTLSNTNRIDLNQTSNTLTRLLESAEASLSNLEFDFTGLNPDLFDILKNEILNLINTCDNVRTSFNAESLDHEALSGEAAIATMQYVNAIFELIQDYITYLKSFLYLADDAVNVYKEGERANATVISEEAATLSAAAAILVDGEPTSSGNATADIERQKGMDRINNGPADSKSTSGTPAASTNGPANSSSTGGTPPSGMSGTAETEQKKGLENLERMAAAEAARKAELAKQQINVTGNISPGTEPTTFAATPYNLSDEEYKVLCATVYAEASERPDYVMSDTMGVTSAILNRLESTKWKGDSVTAIVSAKGQFSGYGYGNRKFSNAMNNPSVISDAQRAAIDKVLAGQRNTTGCSFTGNGVHNKFRA